MESVSVNGLMTCKYLCIAHFAIFLSKGTLLCFIHHTRQKQYIDIQQSEHFYWLLIRKRKRWQQSESSQHATDLWQWFQNTKNDKLRKRPTKITCKQKMCLKDFTSNQKQPAIRIISIQKSNNSLILFPRIC